MTIQLKNECFIFYKYYTTYGKYSASPPNLYAVPKPHGSVWPSSFYLFSRPVLALCTLLMENGEC